MPHPGNLGRRVEGVSLGSSICCGQRSFISTRPSPQPSVGPAFQGLSGFQLELPEGRWYYALCPPCENGPGWGTGRVWHPESVSLTSSRGRLVEICFRDWQGGWSLDENMAEGQRLVNEAALSLEPRAQHPPRPTPSPPNPNSLGHRHGHTQPCWQAGPNLPLLS